MMDCQDLERGHCFCRQCTIAMSDVVNPVILTVAVRAAIWVVGVELAWLGCDVDLFTR